MSKKNKMTPAEVANQLGAFIAKQEETLRKYPVGPMANAARANLKKGRAAIEALKGQNESMRQQMPGQPKMMVTGGETLPGDIVPASESGFEISLRQYNPGNLQVGKGMLNKLEGERFATFPTLEAGWQALNRQLDMYAGKKGLKSKTGITGESTLAEAMAKYAPHYENDTDGYVAQLASAMGVSGDTKIKDLDTKKWATAISRVEGSQGFAALDAAGLLDEEVASQFRDQPVVKEATEIANRFTEAQPKLTADRDTTQYASIFNQTQALESPATPEQQVNRTTMAALPTPEEDKAELDRRMAALNDAEVQETIAMLRENTNDIVAEDAQMRAAGLNRGYLGGTYGQDQTRVQQPIDPAEVQAAQAAAEFARTQKEELGSYGNRVAKDKAAAGAMAQDFPVEDVMTWAEDTYDLVDVETRHGMNVEGFDQRVIQVGQQAMSPEEAAVIMQTLKDNGMTKDEAYEALSSPAVVENVLETNRSGNPLTFNNNPDSPGFSITWNDDYNLDNLKILGKNMSENLTNKQSGQLNRRALANLIEQETGVDSRTLNPIYEEVGFTPEAMADWIQNSTNYSLTDSEYTPGRTKVNTGVDAGPTVTPESLSYMAQGLVDQGFTQQQALKWLENGSNVRELALAGQRNQMKIDADQVSENQGGRRVLPGELYRRGIREAINDPAWLEENTKSGAFKAAGVNVDALESRPMAPLDNPQPSDRVLRQAAVMRDRTERPNDMRVEPNFLPVEDLPAPNVLEAPDMLPISDKPVQDGVTQVPDVVVPEKSAPEQLPTKDAQVPVNMPRKDIQVSGGPEMVQMNMPNMTPLMGIPAMASLASVGIQRRALEKMRGPQAPVLTDIPQFSYQSNLGQQMMDARNATNAAMRADGMSDTARAGMRGNLLAQRFQQEARLRTADNAQRQAAQQRYDQLAYQARATQDALRNKYNEDMVNFSNQKAMLNAQLQQQPLNVLSATTQDYLKNVYAPNLANQIEGLGRQFDTGAYDTSVFDQDT